MTKILISKSHNKPKEEVDKLIEALQVDLADKYGLVSKRQGDCVNFKGSGINGTLTIEHNEVNIDLKLGMMMSMLAGKIKPALKSKLDKYLDD